MMLLIVAHHLVVHGGPFEYEEAGSIRHFFVALMQMGGKVGVDGFVLVSAYFLCTTTAIRFRRFAKLLIQLLTYSLAITLIFVVFARDALVDEVLDDRAAIFFHAIFPIGFATWWFVSAYVVMFLLSPVLNIIVRTVRLAQYRGLLLGGFFFLVVLPTFVSQSWAESNIVWFIYLYFVAAYVRTRLIASMPRKEFALMGGLLAFGGQAALVVRARVDPMPESVSEYLRIGMQQNQLLVFVSALLLFMFFVNLRIGSISVINKLATGAFGVYLIHDHPYVRHWLWQEVARPGEHYLDGQSFYLYAIGVVAAVYLSATLIDIARQYVIEKPVMRLLDTVGISSRFRARTALANGDPDTQGRSATVRPSD